VVHQPNPKPNPLPGEMLLNAGRTGSKLISRAAQSSIVKRFSVSSRGGKLARGPASRRTGWEATNHEAEGQAGKHPGGEHGGFLLFRCVGFKKCRWRTGLHWLRYGRRPAAEVRSVGPRRAARAKRIKGICDGRALASVCDGQAAVNNFIAVASSDV